MTETVLETLLGLLDPGQERNRDTLRLLCADACHKLDEMLRPGVRPGDCMDCYRLAAAWMAMDWLEECDGMGGVTSVSAGDMTVRRETDGRNGKRTRRAMELMAPFIRDPDFVFRGVPG